MSIRPLDLQDNFSKTRLAEKAAEIQRQQAENAVQGAQQEDSQKQREKLQRPEATEEKYRLVSREQRRRNFLRRRKREKEKKGELPLKEEDEETKNRDRNIDLRA
jgi:hypothetical protein